jgi:hypothetical protein
LLPKLYLYLHLLHFHFFRFSLFIFPQGSIYWKIPPPLGEGEISSDVIWGKNMKRGREKEEKCKRKKKKEERKR